MKKRTKKIKAKSGSQTIEYRVRHGASELYHGTFFFVCCALHFAQEIQDDKS